MTHWMTLIPLMGLTACSGGDKDSSSAPPDGDDTTEADDTAADDTSADDTSADDTAVADDTGDTDDTWVEPDEVVLPAGFNYADAEGPKHDWAYWSARGVRLAQGGTPNGAEAQEQATILLPQGANGPAFLALPNHYVIRAYNNSVSYALAIGLTADGIMGKPGLSKAWPNDPAMTRDQRIGAQTALTRLGYDTQGVDGVIGSNTRAALRRWQLANNRTADGYLTAPLADELIRKAN